MNAKAESWLSPRERLARGLAYSVVGPVYVTRGVVGLGVDAAQASARGLRRRYREGRLAHDVAAAQETIGHELAAAQEVVTNLPQALRDARAARRRRSKRPLLIAGAAAAVLAGGAVTFSVVRRSTRQRPQEPSPRPPSVDIQPRP
ncbi:cell wall synthesis protein CwsA [Mycobacterium servetii]|uniref:Cell wall synthesis protein CwsA n=1 Tax=Mycobacterium servetii TaxID=3237418 RepID=A0ABV4BTC6_9MYCO